MKAIATNTICLMILSHSASNVNSSFQVQRNAAVRCNIRSNVRLDMSHKDNERARMERDLENMMGNDWRLFRAKLVAQEKIDEAESSEMTTTTKRYMDLNTLQKKQNQLDNLFKNAVNIFSKSKKNNGGGGAKMDDDELLFSGEGVSCDDPFATVDEILAVRKPRVAIDEQRWAHPISHIEPGCILLATERLRGVFRQAVVLVIDHNEETGSTGIIINRSLPGNLQKIASEVPSNIDTSLKLAFGTAKVSYGGPVMQQDYSILHGYGEVNGSKKVAPGIFVGGSRELMNEVRMNYFNPKDALFIKGHAAWMPGQLSRELKKGVWYTASASSGFILGQAHDEETYGGDLWYNILKCMGDDYADIAERHADSRRMMP